MEVESYILLWQMISSTPKLTHLTLSLCLLMAPVHVPRQMIVTIFQTFHNLLGLEIIDGYCGECADWSLDNLLLSCFPSLTYCKLSYYDNPNILQNAITTCKNLKYFCCNNDMTVSLIPLSCACKLQQLCIESWFTDIPDSFMDMISSHGSLEHIIYYPLGQLSSEASTVWHESFTIVKFYSIVWMKSCWDFNFTEAKFRPQSCSDIY